jgi:hypothetical protein
VSDQNENKSVTDLSVGSASVGNIGVVSRVRQESGSPAQTISISWTACA